VPLLDQVAVVVGIYVSQDAVVPRAGRAFRYVVAQGEGAEVGLGGVVVAVVFTATPRLTSNGCLGLEREIGL